MANEGPCVIGKAITIRGNLTGSEDLLVEGRIEGTVTLKNHLSIEESGVVQADIDVEDLTVKGEMKGDITAAQSVSINNNARLAGNIRAPRVIIEDGARFRGSIDMDVELPEGIEFASLGSVNRLVGLAQQVLDSSVADEGDEAAGIQVVEIDLADGSVIYAGGPVVSTPVSEKKPLSIVRFKAEHDPRSPQALCSRRHVSASLKIALCVLQT